MATPRVELLLIRHGETEGNVARVSQGITDSPLTARGQAQVRKLGQHMASRFRFSGAGKPIVHLLLASPLGRTMRTAQGILDAWGHAAAPQRAPDHPEERFAAVSDLVRCWSQGNGMFFTDCGLMERSFGAREGYSRGARVSGFAGGSGLGETHAEFAARVKRTAVKWIDMALKACDDIRQECAAPQTTLSAGSSSSTPRNPCPEVVRIVLVTHGLWIKQCVGVLVPHGMGGSGFLTNTSITTLSLSSLPPGHRLPPPSEPQFSESTGAKRAPPPPRPCQETLAKKRKPAADAGIPAREAKARRTLVAKRELPLTWQVVGANETPHLGRGAHNSQPCPGTRQSSLRSFLQPKG